MPSAIIQPQIQAIDRSFSTIFRTAYTDTPTWWNQVATLIPSSHRSNVYGWMQRILKMEEWLGPRTKQNLNTHEYEVINRTFEATVSVEREQIEDDQVGVLAPRVAELGRAGAKLPDQLARDALQNGTTRLGFDGLPMFSAAHDLDPITNPAQSNNFTGLGSIDTTAWNSVRSAMKSYTGEDGEPFAVDPRLILCPPQLETDWLTVLNNEFIVDPGGVATNISNPLKGTASLMVIPELANEGTVSYVADVSRPIMGLIWQLRRAVTMTQKTQPNDDGVFYDNEFVWGTDGRGEVSYGPWWLLSRMAL